MSSFVVLVFLHHKMSGLGSDDQCQKEQELQKENLRLSSENMELRFQLEQANKDLPRLKVNISLQCSFDSILESKYIFLKNSLNMYETLDLIY